MIDSKVPSSITQIIFLKLIVSMEYMCKEQEIVCFGTSHLLAAVCFLFECPLCRIPENASSFLRTESCLKVLTSWLKACMCGNLQILGLIQDQFQMRPNRPLFMYSTFSDRINLCSLLNHARVVLIYINLYLYLCNEVQIFTPVVSRCVTGLLLYSGTMWNVL